MATPEERRDAAIGEVIAAGGSILSVAPLATPDTPHVVAAYRLTVGSSDLATHVALSAVRRETEASPLGLIGWVAPEDAQ